MERRLKMSTQETKSRKAYRQGELLFIPLSSQELKTLNVEVRDGLDPQWTEIPNHVLREGEATGHKHEVVSEKLGTTSVLAPTQQFRGLPDMDNLGFEDRLILAQQPIEIIHPEHRSLKLPQGAFLVIVQREYDEVKSRRILD